MLIFSAQISFFRDGVIQSIAMRACRWENRWENQ